MATAKKTTKKSIPTPKVRRIRKFNFDLSRIQSKFRSEYDKHASVYPVAILVVIVLIVLIGLFIFQRGLFVAGSINGRMVTTAEFYGKLVKGGGKSTFDSIVRETLISQEAAKKNITVSSKEIDDRLAKIKTRFGGEDAFKKALVDNNTSLEDLRQQVGIQILAEKLLAKDIAVTEAEIDKYIADNKDAAAGMSRADIKDQLQSQKLNEKLQPWYDEVKKNAKINQYF